MKPDTNPVSTSSVLDIEQNIWLKLPDMPTARYAAGTFLKEDKLYLLGKPDTNKNHQNRMTVSHSRSIF